MVVIESVSNPLSSPVAALSCNENDGESMDRDSQYSSSQKTKRMRTSFKHHQLRTMKSYFAINHNPDAKDLKQLAQKSGLTKRVLQVPTTILSSTVFVFSSTVLYCPPLYYTALHCLLLSSTVLYCP